MDLGTAIRQVVQSIGDATARSSTPTPVSSPSSQDLFSKIGTPTWNYAYEDNRLASVTGEDGKEYFFVPQSYVQKGQVQGNFQQYTKQFLDPNTFKNAVAFELPEGMQSRLENKGFLWPADEFNKLGLSTYSGYNIDENNPAIVGLGNPHPSMQVGAPISYITQPKLAPGGERVQQDWITAADGRQGGLGQYAYYKYQGPLADAARGGLQAIGPLAPLLLEYAAPGMGLGVAYSAGNAAGKLATGQPGAAQSLATSVILGQLGVGSTVAGATGSTLAGQVAQGTAAGLLTGKNPETALTSGVVGAGAGLAGSTVAGETGSAVAGQVAAGTTAGLLTGKTAEQSLVQGVGNIKLDSLIPDSGVTVANEAQVTAGQTALQDSLAPFLKDTTASAFDTKDIIDDNSGFSTTTTAPVTIDSGVINPAQTVANVVGTDATKIDTTQTTVNTGVKAMGDEVIDYEGAGMSAGLSEYLADPEGATMYAGIQQALNLDPEGAAMSAGLSQAIQDYSTGTGLSVKDVVKFFKDNPNLAKAATSVIAKGVGLFGTKLATDTATEAARVAAEAMKFKPVGVTTRFGATDYKYDDKGNLVSAGYTLTPDLKAIQDKLMSGATLSLDEAKKVADLYDPLKKASTSLFDLGTSYLAKTPEQVASDYMAKQQDLLAPSRERQMSQLQNTLFQQGRGGLSVGATSARPSGARGLGATTPEMEAYYNALAQQDAQLAAGAQQAGQQSVLFGKGLLGAGGEFLGKYTAGQAGAYDPFKTLLSTAGAVESMGAGALDVGTTLGGRSTTAATNAARTLQPSASYNPYGSLFSGIGSDPQFQLALQDFISGGGLKP
jgi:hypothetical protein